MAAPSTPKRQLVVNYVPGEDCRIAVMQEGKLEEFHSERFDSLSHVGNIYVGRVTNVEPAISAAFVDFGLQSAGFLHVSDLHPRYFPGEDGETTERVGKKTPRRDRPPIQEALKKGQEVIVQVLKEGVGSKGPTLTSYLSIPGRYLVMMPQMDRVGVSRKVEDEDIRKKMVAILDALELPEGFGFIVRTAGLDRTKTELKRDLAYLQRLWKDMEKRRKIGTKPRLLYSESDLLVRSLRDMLTSDTDQVIVDHDHAIQRAARFIKIVSPRTVTKLVHFKGRTPIFHALAIEDQIRTMYAREVPLSSGGRLVIDETEALVAIDVNSGKSRSSGDSETNAYKTNLEAADEICRQLRLRDLGGIVVNDLIDMRLAKHRRDVETKFESILKEDRARSSITPISEFGILEMTRQRMRGSHEQQHFHDCPACHGRGKIQKAESVANDAIREMAALLDHNRVQRVELVIHPRVAGEILSNKRRALARLEKLFNKRIECRLADAMSPDRFTLYAYDEHANDIEIDKLPRFKVTDEVLQAYVEPETLENEEEEAAWVAQLAAENEEDPDPPASADFPEPLLIEQENSVEAPAEPLSPDLGETKGGRRRGRGRGRGRGRADAPATPVASPAAPAPTPGTDRATAPNPLVAASLRTAPPANGRLPSDLRGAPPRYGPAWMGAFVGTFHRRDGGIHRFDPGHQQPAGKDIRIPDQPVNGAFAGDSTSIDPFAAPASRRRRRRRGGRGRGEFESNDQFDDGPEQQNAPANQAPRAPAPRPAPQPAPPPRDEEQPARGRRGGRRRRGRGAPPGDAPPSNNPRDQRPPQSAPPPLRTAPPPPRSAPPPQRSATPAPRPAPRPAPAAPAPAPAINKPRTLYASHRRLKPGERPTGKREE